ncbi:MAG: hypothetical protein AB1716_10325 [Planctomycetota bacterium]
MSGSRAVTTATLGLVLLLLSGCQGALIGDWRMISAGQSRHVFSIERASFREDGSFETRTTVEGVTLDEKGRYEFNGVKLRLWPAGGGLRMYTATLGPGRVTLMNGKRSVVLERARG